MWRHVDRKLTEPADAKAEVARLEQELEHDPSDEEQLERLLPYAEEEVSFLEDLFPDKATRRRSGFDIREWRKRNMTLHRLKFEWRLLEMGRKPPEWWSGGQRREGVIFGN